MAERIRCCVPYCRRTFKRSADHDDETETMCGKHYRLADPLLRAKRSTINRRRTAALNRMNWPLVDRLTRISNFMWRKIKRQAIERALGI